LCTPSLAIDAIIEVAGETPSVVLVHRRDPPKDFFAICGGFVDVGETGEYSAGYALYTST
jgi:ADP-ribose pyrophosphatase YjhB (NUDIX family)